MNHGFVDWLTATGANMYHDIHYAFNLPMFRGTHTVDDADLRDKGVTRIYDILFDYEDVLMETDRKLREIMLRPEFQKEMGTREFYYLLGKILNDYEKKNKTGQVSILAAAYRNGIPVFTSSPGDSTIGMNVAGLELLAEASGLLDKFKLKINPSIDVNDSTAIILNAKNYEKGKTGVILIGGGSPKNFMLQTEPQIQEVLMIPEVGQDYDINVTDARPDTGGLSGAPPSEAASWGKIDPTKLEETVTAYLDVTVAFPIMVAYAIQTTKAKKLKRLYDRGEELHKKLIKSYLENNKEVEKLRSLIKKLWRKIYRPAACNRRRPATQGNRSENDKSNSSQVCRKARHALFIIDHDKIRKNYRHFKKNLPRVQAYYAVKANSNQEIIKTLFDEGCSFDVASYNEFMQVYEYIKHFEENVQGFLHLGQDHLLQHHQRQGNAAEDKKISAACYLRQQG